MQGCGTMEKKCSGSPYDLYCLNTAATLSILFFLTVHQNIISLQNIDFWQIVILIPEDRIWEICCSWGLVIQISLDRIIHCQICRLNNIITVWWEFIFRGCLHDAILNSVRSDFTSGVLFFLQVVYMGPAWYSVSTDLIWTCLLDWTEYSDPAWLHWIPLNNNNNNNNTVQVHVQCNVHDRAEIQILSSFHSLTCQIAPCTLATLSYMYIPHNNPISLYLPNLSQNNKIII